MTDKPLCEVCGEPMPPGEEMFKFHGYSGDCPKPPLLPKPMKVLVEQSHRDDAEGFWIDITVDRQAWTTLGPFGTASERQRAHDDLLEMMRSQGAQDLPLHPQ